MTNARRGNGSQGESGLLVCARRDGKAIYYSIADERVRQLVRLMYQLFCGPDSAAKAA